MKIAPMLQTFADSKWSLYEYYIGDPAAFAKAKYKGWDTDVATAELRALLAVARAAKRGMLMRRARYGETVDNDGELQGAFNRLERVSRKP